MLALLTDAKRSCILFLFLVKSATIKLGVERIKIMSAVEKREKYQIIAHGKITNYWATDSEEEANLIYDMIVNNLFRKRYHKISFCEWESFGYIVKNEVCALLSCFR